MIVQFCQSFQESFFLEFDSRTISAKFRDVWRTGAADFDFNRYHSLGEIENYMDKMAMAFPEFVELRTIGRTHEGRQILAMRVRK